MVWDKVLGFGTTDPITGMEGDWAGYHTGAGRQLVLNETSVAGCFSRPEQNACLRDEQHILETARSIR